MSYKKGFTLAEIIVVMIIIGLLAAIAIPYYMNAMQTQTAITAQNNLTIIYNAEKNYYANNGFYCVNPSANPSANPCDNLNDINTTLSLNIIDPNLANNDGYFTYTCIDPNALNDGNNGSSFSCTAMSNADPKFVLTLINQSIILPGGSVSPGGVGIGTYNPACTNPDNPSVCPS